MRRTLLFLKRRWHRPASHNLSINRLSAAVLSVRIPRAQLDMAGMAHELLELLQVCEGAVHTAVVVRVHVLWTEVLHPLGRGLNGLGIGQIYRDEGDIDMRQVR